MVATTFKKPLEKYTSNSPPSDLHPHRRIPSMPQLASASVRKKRGVRGQDQLKTRNDSEKITDVREVKVLLLGQSESGKSTLQRNLQIHLSQTTFNASRSAYKPVVYLNIITALRALLIELDYQLSFPSRPSITVDNSKFFASVRDLRNEVKLDEIRVRLLPLMALESLLVAEFTEGVTFATSGAQPEAFVRPGWQTRIAQFWNLTTSCKRSKGPSADLALLCSKTLAFSVLDIHALWNHWITRFYVSKRVVPLDDTAPYFLDEIERIGGVGYCPTDEDILHSRIQTVGVTEAECAMPLSIAKNPTWKWKVYDVSGVRGQRGVWVPFFDDASVVIFLAPISAFDQYLLENPTINRLVDSLHLWASICSNKLLQHARLVLFLNKIDLLKKKLDDGVSVRKYITSFSNRSNDFVTAASYFRAHFEQIQQRKDIARVKRRLFVHFTSMLDTKAMVTQHIVSQVKEVILKQYAEEQTII